MKKCLDEAFCQYLVDHSIIDQGVLSDISTHDSITKREALLINDQIPSKSYQDTLKQVLVDKTVVDTTNSQEYDEAFLEQAFENEWINQADIDECRRNSSVLSIRESLLVSGVIDPDQYKSISSFLNQTPDSEDEIDSSEETVIDELPSSQREETVEEHIEEDFDQERDPSEETIIDSPLLKKFDSISTSETVVTLAQDMENSTSDYNLEATNFGHLPVHSDRQTTDASSETLIDQPITSPEETQEEYRDPIDYQETVTFNEFPSGAYTPAPQVTTSDESNFDETSDLLEKFIHSESEPKNRETTKVEKGDLVVPSDLPEIEKEKEVVAKLPPNFLESLREEISKDVVREIHEKTQEISLNVNKGVGSHKTLASLIIFFSVSIMIFTFWVEYQRMSDLKEIRMSRDTLEKANKLLISEKNSLTTANIKLQEKALELSDSKSTIINEKHKVEKEFEKLKRAAKEQRGKVERIFSSAEKSYQNEQYQRAFSLLQACYVLGITYDGKIRAMMGAIMHKQKSKKSREEAKKYWQEAREIDFEIDDYINKLIKK